MRVGKALRLLGWKKGRTKASRFWQSTMTTSNETVTTPEAVTTSNEAKASEHSTAPKGGHPAEVVTQGGHLENGGHSVVRDRVTTVTTSSAHVRVTPCSSNVQNPVRGGHGGHPAGGSASRKRIGACAYCHDAAYRDDAAPLTSGGVLHYRCSQLWLESQPK